MKIYIVTQRFLSLSTGKETVVKQDVSADSMEEAFEKAALRASRGHGRMILKQNLSVVQWTG